MCLPRLRHRPPLWLLRGQDWLSLFPMLLRRLIVVRIGALLQAQAQAELASTGRPRYRAATYGLWVILGPAPGPRRWQSTGMAAPGALSQAPARGRGPTNSPQ